MRKYVFLIVAVMLVSQVRGESLAWPQFRGPGGSSVANEGENPPVEVGPEKNVLWKVPVPSGLSSPIVVGDKLVLTAFDDGKLYTIAYNRADGSEAWRAEAPAREIEKYFKAAGSPAASTPATDGERIVSYFGSCGLVCYDTAGNELWKYEMPTAKTLGNFGTGVSPVIVDGLVVLLRDVVDEAKIIAVNAATGELQWEAKRQSNCSFCTPAIWNTPQGKQIAAPGHGQMTGYDLKTGKEAWFVLGMPSSTCASPVASQGKLYFAAWSPGAADDDGFKMPTFDALLKDQVGDDDGDGTLSRDEAADSDLKDFFDSQDANGDGKITRDEWDAMVDFMASATNCAFAVEPGGRGDITKSHVLWKQTKGLPYVASAVVVDGQYLMVKDGGILTGYDTKTGKELFQNRSVAEGTYYASPVAAGARVYFTSLEDGTITVVEVGAEAPKVLAKNPPLGEKVGATPAIADDTLYVRTESHLYAFAAE
jgi:outer membrane protein assembly factor BamB